MFSVPSSIGGGEGALSCCSGADPDYSTKNAALRLDGDQYGKCIIVVKSLSCIKVKNYGFYGSGVYLPKSRVPGVAWAIHPIWDDTFLPVHYYYSSLTPALDVLDICSFLLFS